jgi:hypothetical protein
MDEIAGYTYNYYSRSYYPNYYYPNYYFRVLPGRSRGLLLSEILVMARQSTLS